jgi:alginate O-acetyltransferase complex protein AlgI
MLFSSPAFFVFIACFLVAYAVVPPRLRLAAIIAGSTVFYAWWRVEYVFVPFGLALLGYWGALAVSPPGAPGRRRRARLAVVLFALFLPLAVVKYFDFVSRDVVGAALGAPTPTLGLALPLGISFVTFTVCAYVVDVYRGAFPAERRLSRLLGFVLFFPHLIAGPILRPRELIPQLSDLRSLAGARATLAASIFTLGLVKKLVFADQISGVVDAVYSGHATSGLDCWLAIYGFSMQIYCDFSGYSDMAIGIAMLLRIRLPNNFARPYSSASIAEFWRRWHITLSHWLRDYLYIPLGGNRHGRAREVANLIVTMALGGLWHGANWTFVCWGLVHGLALSARRIAGLPPSRSRWARWISVVATFHFVAFSWILFRAPDLETARRVAAGALAGPSTAAVAFIQGHAFALLLLLVFLATHRLDSHARVRIAVSRLPRKVVWLALLGLWMLAITVSQGSSANFIYFDF